MTSFTGPKCEDESVALEWGSNTGLAKYRPDESLNTETDTLALGVITALEEATLLRVDSATSNDYMEMEIVEGNVVVVYNLGQKDIIIQVVHPHHRHHDYHPPHQLLL